MSPFRFIQSQPRGSDAEQTVESNVHDTAANRALPARVRGAVRSLPTSSPAQHRTNGAKAPWTRHNGTMGRAWIAIFVAVPALAVAPATALAKRHVSHVNVTSTRAYVKADFTLVSTARSNLKTGEAALEELQSKLGAECPGAATASPENEAAEKLSNEVIGAMSTVFIRADAQAVETFATEVAGLRWSNQKLTHKVSSYAAKLKALAVLAMPNVCGDVSAWAASGYRTLPASTTQFDQQFSAQDVGIGEVPARLLAPYESAGERATLRRTTRFEEELVEAEARAVEPWGKILNALDLQP
jgi:hypothetical protein